MSVGIGRRSRYVDQEILGWISVAITKRLDCYAITEPLTGVGVKMDRSDIRTANRIASPKGYGQIRAKTLKDTACLFPGLRRIDMLSHKLSPAGLLILKTLELLKKFKAQMLSTSDFMNVFVKKRLNRQF